MNFEPFDTSLVIERLKAQVQELRQVGGAADYAAVQELRGFAVPSAFVIFAGESGNAGRPARCSRAARRHTLWRGACRAQLPAWCWRPVGRRTAQVHRPDPLGPDWLGSPVPGATALAWEAGEVMDYDNSTVLYVESYQLTHLLQK
jgi:hypothetical protein